MHAESIPPDRGAQYAALIKPGDAVTTPAAEAYGVDGNVAQGIGPDETLVFVVDLVAVSETPKYCNANTVIPPAPEGTPGGETKPTDPIELPITPPTELKIATVRPSEGAEVADGDKVKVGSARGIVTLHAKAHDGQRRGVLIAESIWPNEAFEDGQGINTLTGCDQAAPAAGGLFHDNRVWLKPAR